MSQYTLTIRDIVENSVDVFAGWDFPIFTPSAGTPEQYKTLLKNKIIDHYYFREIGVETVGRFIWNLRTRMNEIMPYFNKRYEAMELPQRILDNYDVTETYNRSTSNQGTQAAKKLFSDVAQGRVDITTNDYVSEINDDSGSTTDTGTENWTRHIEGNYGVQTDAKAVVDYLESLINVDVEVIEALNDLFMQVY